MDSYKKRRRMSEDSSSSSGGGGGWAWLPKDILGSILEKLTLLSDYDRFGAVCASWRHASLDVCNRNRRLETQLLSSSDRRKVPLLLLALSSFEDISNSGSKEEEQRCKHISLYDVVQRKTVVEDFKLIPALLNSRGRFCGSSHGWLVRADDSLSLTLVNPFYIGGGAQCGGGIIRLPPIDCPPGDRFGCEILGDECITELAICKVVLSADPAVAPHNYVVMVIYGQDNSLALFKSGDKDWTYVAKPKRDPFAPCEDVAYSNGRIYAVLKDGELLCCDIANPTPKLKKLAPPPPLADLLDRSHRHLRRYYIVETPQGDLLLVYRVLDFSIKIYKRHEPVFLTFGFKVFKLQVQGNLTEWVEIKSLGDKALFLGENHSTCISVSHEYPGFQPDSVYFTDDALSNYASTPDILQNPIDMGVFSLEDESFRRCYDLDGMSQLVRIRPPIWFLPSFPGNWA